MLENLVGFCPAVSYCSFKCSLLIELFLQMLPGVDIGQPILPNAFVTSHYTAHHPRIHLDANLPPKCINLYFKGRVLVLIVDT